VNIPIRNPRDIQVLGIDASSENVPVNRGVSLHNALRQ